MISLISRLATRRALLLLVAGYLVVFGAILITLGQLSAVSGGQGILDFDLGYTPDRVAEVYGSYGDRGFALYRRIQWLDLINPALYSLIAAALTYRLWRRWGGRGPSPWRRVTGKTPGARATRRGTLRKCRRRYR